MAMQILNDEMYELLVSVKNAQRAQPNLTMEKFTGTDGDEPSSYSDAQINAIMDFWKNPVDNYIKVSDLTGTGQKLDEISMSFKDQLTQSETRNNEAIKALSDRVEDELKKNGETLAQSLKEHQEKAFSAFEEKQNKSIENLQAKHEQALKDSEERQQKQFADFSSKLFADLDAKLSSFSSAVALHDEIKSSQTAQPKAEKVNESAVESKPESENNNENTSENTSEQLKQSAESENNSASGDKSESEVKKQPEVRSDEGASEDEAGEESEHVSKDEGADAQGGAETASSESGEPSGGQGVHESVEASSADLAQVIAELRNLTRSVDKLSENFKTGFDELKKEVSEISCISPVPLEPKDPEKTDGSDDVINKIVKETAMSSLLASPLAILDATLRQYRDSFARRYEAAMGCLMAQDGEVNLQFGRNAQQSLELVKNNRADYQHAVMALTQSPVATKPKAEGKSEHPQSVGVKEPAKRVRNVSHTTVKRNDVKRVDEHERSVNHSQETSPKPGAQSYAKLISDVNGSELK